MDKGALRVLGVLLLSTVFHRSPALVELHLTNPNTELTPLRARSSGKLSEAGHEGLRVTATEFRYVPCCPDRVPIAQELSTVPVAYLPSVILAQPARPPSRRRPGFT